MPQEPLDLCGIEPHDNGDESNPNRNSVLYNAMIHPLIRLSIKGALWYQGKNKNKQKHLHKFIQCALHVGLREAWMQCSII